jgi:lysophosphatidic acid phosphatase type 6
MSRLWRLTGAFGGAAALASLTAAAVTPHTAEAKSPEPSSENKDTLKLVQVVFRHGARTPLSKNYWPELVDKWDVCGQLFDPVPVDVIDESGAPRPENSHDKQQRATILPGGECSKGELTREGQRQARMFGRWLRQRYVSSLDFLPEEYLDGILYCRTTNYSRTVATLQGVLTGLFPDTKKGIQVKTTEEMDEILFGNAASCTRLKEIIKNAASVEKEAILSPDVLALQNRVQEALGLPPTTAIKFLDLHDTVTTMLTHNKPIPEGLRDAQLLKQIEDQATARFMKFIVGDHSSSNGGGKEDGEEKQQKPSEILRLGMGRLMHFMVKRMEETASSTKKEQNKEESTPKFYLLSGHDSTIIPLLAALGVDIDHWPQYLSNIVFELWQKPNGEHYIQVLYNKEPLNMENVCSGSKHCSLKSLRQQVLGPYLLSHRQRENECLVHFSHDEPAGKHVKEVEVGSSLSEE